jgi:DNA-binding MarR family transcriptional regulator
VPAAPRHMRLDNSRYDEYYCIWKMKTQTHKPKPCLEETVFLDLLRTSDVLSRRIDYVLKDADLSSNQYNVLRILRGSPEGLACGEIGSRMITRDPDITRLLDRLEKRALISRCRESKDRRTVLTRITPAGVKLLAELDEPVQQAHRGQLGHMGRERLKALSELLRVSQNPEA